MHGNQINIKEHSAHIKGQQANDTEDIPGDHHNINIHVRQDKTKDELTSFEADRGDFCSLSVSQVCGKKKILLIMLFKKRASKHSGDRNKSDHEGKGQISCNFDEQ